MVLSQKLYKIKGVVQHYSWGGYDFIPFMLGVQNAEHKPFAEYWLGAHANHPATLQNEASQSLAALLRTSGPDLMGVAAANKFGTLPYLLKILDVRQMLSIQVHPSKQAAAVGYRQENEGNIPLQAGHRNYKDENHKPELMVALSDFWLLHGFKSPESLKNIFAAVPELAFLEPLFDDQGYKGLYEAVMQMDQGRVNDTLQSLVGRITVLYEQGKLQKDQEDFWAARAVSTFCRNGNIDRGIFSIYLFNLLHLGKGEGIFQAAGLPHAYLEGQNVEVMANSDNVLRAGLTDKHIDVAELMKHVVFEPTIPAIIHPDPAAVHKVFSTPAEEFELHQYDLDAGQHIDVVSGTAEVFLVTEGTLVAEAANQSLSLSRGDAFMAPVTAEIAVRATSRAQLFRVTLPVDINS